MVSITLQHVTRTFGEVVALSNLSLEIRKGELFFLLGPSGCGKTTLLRCLAGFYTLDHGRIYFDEEDVTYRPPHLRNTAMVFQSWALWPHMNVAQNVAFGLQQKRLPRGVIEERVRNALRMVKMEKYTARKINELSGGQQQRVALARALVVEPACLLLDEPLSNLDARLRLEMRMEIRRICWETGLTTVYVTHDQKEALSVADRIALLENGTFSQIGTPDELYRNPVSRSVAGFIGETNFIRGRLIEPGRRKGFWIVETSAGSFEGRVSRRSSAPRFNDHVLLSIRPECFVLRPAEPEANFLSGRVSGRTYLGELVQYELTCQGIDQSLQVSEMNPRELKEPSGQIIHAEVAPEDVVILQPS